MGKLIVGFCAVAFCLMATATEVQPQAWQKTFGGAADDRGYSVQQTTDRGYIITGYTESFGPGLADVWLIKTDSLGDSLWTKTFGGGSDDRGYSVQQTTDGGYVVTGSNFIYLWLIRTGPLGDTLWTKTFSTPWGSEGRSVQQTTDSGYVLTGRIGSTLGWDIWLVKTGPLGDTLWTRTFGDLFLEDCGYSVQQTTDGGYIVAGFVAEGTLWLAKTDASGDTLWTRTFDDSQGYSVRQTADGGYIVAGGCIGDLLLIRANALGDTLWTRTFGGAGDDWGYSVQQTTDRGYIITGYTESFGPGLADVWLIKTDSLGDSLWTKTFGGGSDDRGYSVQQTTDGGYIITGYTESFGAGPADLWLIKTDSLGNVCVEEDRNRRSVPRGYTLHQNSPNPFAHSTTIPYSVPGSRALNQMVQGRGAEARRGGDLSTYQLVNLSVYDVTGRLMKTLVDHEFAPGFYKAVWDGRDSSGREASPGVYFYRLTVGDFAATRKLVLLR